VDRPAFEIGIFPLPHGSKTRYISDCIRIMSTHFDDAFLSLPGLLNDDQIFDFEAASGSNNHPNDRYSRRRTVDDAEVSDAEVSDASSDNDDGLFCDGTSNFDGNSDGEEAEEEDVGTAGDPVHSWKIDHSSGDHKLRRKSE
jgi:hypothetical protein